MNGGEDLVQIGCSGGKVPELASRVLATGVDGFAEGADCYDVADTETHSGFCWGYRSILEGVRV